jgi:hypothetical protein
MGGFLFCRKSGRDAPVDFGPSMAAMQAKGLRRKSVITRSQFDLHVYEKMRVDTDNVLELDNGDFVVATGTMIYKKRMGAPALQNLYSDYCDDRLSFENFLGHFAVWILKGDDLIVFNDYRGMYQVFHDVGKTILCSAFLPVCESLTTRTPNTQEIFEYLTFTSTFDEQTILQEVQTLDRRYLHSLFGGSSAQIKRISIPDFDGERPFGEQAQHVHEMLGDYFSILASNFGDLQSIGLTGGYDSRLALAHLRQAGVRPVVYVQGAPDSIDVRIAKSIASGEGFDILYDENEARRDFPLSEFQARTQTAYHYLDGIPHTGIFADMAMVSDERRNTKRAEKLRLYGAGGEIFRRFRNIPDRPLGVAAFMTCEYDSFDDSMYTALFDRDKFLKNIAQKLIDTMNWQRGPISCRQNELAYAHCTLPQVAGPQMTLQNERAFSLVPYSEPMFTFASEFIPLEFKYLGIFEAELIRLADPGLAGYQSAYGYAFSDGPNLRVRAMELAKQYFPISLRPFTVRQLERFRPKRKIPFYLQNEYVREIFPNGCPHIEAFLDIDRLANPNRLSRAYTVELILSGRLGK